MGLDEMKHSVNDPVPGDEPAPGIERRIGLLNGDGSQPLMSTSTDEAENANELSNSRAKQGRSRPNMAA
jgi:hypothetical protein